MKTAVINVRVTREIKSQLSALAASKGLTESGVIRRLIEVELGRHQEPDVPMPKPQPDGTQRKKITLTIPAFIADLAKDRAAMKGMSLTRWIACLIQSHVYEPPVLTTVELKVLNESNRQIRAMGVNINQIARSFNSLDIDIRKLKDFYLIEALIKENINVIDKLIRAANRSWGVGRGSH